MSLLAVGLLMAALLLPPAARAQEPAGAAPVVALCEGERILLENGDYLVRERVKSRALLLLKDASGRTKRSFGSGAEIVRGRDDVIAVRVQGMLVAVGTLREGVYELEVEPGVVRFGDGQPGRRPPTGDPPEAPHLRRPCARHLERPAHEGGTGGRQSRPMVPLPTSDGGFDEPP